MDASEIYSKRLFAKEAIFPQKGEFIFPIADERIKIPGEDQELRTSTLIRPRPSRGEGHIDFFGESEGSFPQPHDSFPVAGEAVHDFWTMSGSFMIGILMALETCLILGQVSHNLLDWKYLTDIVGPGGD